LDILTSVRTFAGKMSTLEELKRQFGKEIIFCGAILIDRQCVAPS